MDDEDIYDNCEPATEHGFHVTSASHAKENTYLKPLPAGHCAGCEALSLQSVVCRLCNSRIFTLVSATQLHEAGARDLIQAVSTKAQYQTNGKDDAHSSSKRLLTTLAVLSLLTLLLFVATIPYLASMTWQSFSISKIADFQNNISTAWDDLTQKYSELSEQIKRLEKNSSEQVCKSIGGHYSRRKCYIVPYLSSEDNTTYSEAVTECAKYGALLTEIHDRDQQFELHDFVLPMMPVGRNYVYIWVGMEYQSSTSELLYRSGKRIPTSQLQWDSGYPSGTHIFLLLEVGSDGDPSVGLWNSLESALQNGVMCEKDV